ncbi:MAG: D-glycero-alpha-D-manno-heptose-1,7-bisphosphate 7-phosphatase [Vicinamibacterales bacterium]
MRPAVFLDRDGTLIEDVDYLNSFDQMALFPWTVDALRLAGRAGFLTVVVTNQSAVGRGIVSEDFVVATHEELSRRLARGGASIDAFYFCPHHPDAVIERYRGACRCRKPEPGMIEDAVRDLDIDLARSWVVGDRWIDVAMGTAAGARSVLVRTGHAEREHEALPADPSTGVRADAILNNLMEAVGWILRDSTSP